MRLAPCAIWRKRDYSAKIHVSSFQVIEGKIGQDHFPLVVFQTGSGTQTNMNVNEASSSFDRPVTSLVIDNLALLFRSSLTVPSRFSVASSDRRSPFTPMTTSTCHNRPTTREWSRSVHRNACPDSEVDFASFPTAMHVSAVVEISNSLIPALQELHDEMYKKQKQFENIIKIGRTHLQVRLRRVLVIVRGANLLRPSRMPPL